MGKTASTGRAGTWLVVVILMVFLGLAVVIAYVGWGMADDEPTSTMTFGGYVAMTFGIIATLALGIGLMSLMYYSNRRGDDR